MLKFSDINIGPKLVSLFIFTGIIPLCIAGFFSSRMAIDALMDKSFNQLITVQELRRSELQNTFKDQYTSIRMIAQNPQTIKFINDLISDQGKSNGGLRVDSEQQTNSYIQYFKKYSKMSGYKDLIVVDAQSENVLLSTEGKTHRTANLLSGEFKQSGLVKVFQKVVESKKGGVEDFASYEPSGGIQSAFYGEPVFDSQEKLIAVIVVQLPPSFLTNIIESRKGMGQTGESYIVGWSKKNKRFEFRTDLRTMGDGKYVTGAALGKLNYWEDAVKYGVKGNHGTYIDSAGKKVLAAYNLLDVNGVEWYLISKIDKFEVESPVRAIIIKGLGISSVLIIFIGVAAFIMARKFTRPIIEDMEFAQAISEGNFEKQIELNQKDELGQLADALNRMARELYEIDWMKNGKEGLNDALRGEHDDHSLAQQFISFIVKHLNAQIGAVYQCNGSDLKLIGSYAFTDRKGNFNHIKIGEGMVGQAAAEREMINFTDVEDDAPKINYGAGERPALNYLIVPLLYQEALLGVFLVGAVNRFTHLQLDFIKQNTDNTAIRMNTVRSQQTIKELYKQAQEQQAELELKNKTLEAQTQKLKASEAELQAQQEELRVTNEELEEQANKLKESEAELQAQQEELRVTNEELETHAKTLEKQQEEMRLRNEDLENAQVIIKNKAKEVEIASKYKSEFLANMSHELRTPLNSILILSQVLSKNKEENLTQKQIQSASTIHSSGKDLLNLINEILDLSRIESGRVEIMTTDVEVKNIVKDLNRTFKYISEQKQVGFNINVDPAVPGTIQTDDLRLQQILRNLLTNAFKFTKEGAVDLIISRPGVDIVMSTDLRVDTSIAFAVRDDGIGIPEDKQAVIFEAFQQADGSTNRKYGGTGLGLSISRELAKLLGGFIHLESRVDQGSTFTVVIPENHENHPPEAQTRENTVPKSEEPTQKPAPENASKKSGLPDGVSLKGDFVRDDREKLNPGDKVLLVIEDDYKSAKLMRDFSRERGFKCIVAENGETGLHFAEYYLPSAIILDIGLPGIDGWTVMERLKNNSSLSHIPVHFMSANEGTMDAMRMGAIGFLSKPISIVKVDETFATIENIIAKPIKNLLIVEDDPIQSKSMKALIGNGDVVTTIVSTGEEAYQKLSEGLFDCMVLDLGLEDMSGFELLEKIDKNYLLSKIPVIVYTGRELSEKEDKQLRRYTESIIIKGAKSPERLLEESALFLHRVESNLPKDKQKILKMVHAKETVLGEKTILVADDDIRNIFALSSILEEKGMTVIVARDGVEALEKVKKHKEIDIVLMDIMMPNMDGYEAIKKIRKDIRNKKLPIIALTAKAMKGDRNKCIDAGANDYLAKPVDTDKLVAMLRVWLY
ncbi:response regulator [uncultured Desulfobacter sp.]|uniref:response regulator n=1 Tax=uncultured Desulfobacter sp. TaxID=240139 RepID=UPI0029F58A84|nr:response regulator [uncultured Desulfobacter sp.]